MLQEVTYDFYKIEKGYHPHSAANQDSDKKRQHIIYVCLVETPEFPNEPGVSIDPEAGRLAVLGMVMNHSGPIQEGVSQLRWCHLTKEQKALLGRGLEDNNAEIGEWWMVVETSDPSEQQ